MNENLRDKYLNGAMLHSDSFQWFQSIVRTLRVISTLPASNLNSMVSLKSTRIISHKVSAREILKKSSVLQI